MCLYVSSRKPEVATKDIICYKVISLDTNHPNNWRGPYWGDFFNFGEVKTTGKKEILYDKFFGIYTIRKGYFHAMTSLKLAEELLHILEREYLLRFRNESRLKYLKIVKCIIPAGNKYFIDTRQEEICSDSMIIIDNTYEGVNRIKNNNCIITFFKTLINKFK